MQSHKYTRGNEENVPIIYWSINRYTVTTRMTPVVSWAVMPGEPF